jgi:hypothetical protein
MKILMMSADISKTPDSEDSATCWGDVGGETTDETPYNESDARRRLRVVGRGCLAVLLLLIVAVGPAAAQSANPICQNDSQILADMVEGFIQITVGLGVMGLLVVWQADSLAEMFTIDREQMTRFKRHKRQAGKSALTLVAIGPLFLIAKSAMDLPIADCVDLIPF